MTTPEIVPVTVKRIVGPTILLHSGSYFDFENPERSLFDVGDIARGLSHICRFAGQCGQFYSVAEHSVHVSRIVPPELALAGLLHDAAEAFIGDMAKPLKIMCPDYQKIEKRIERAVLNRFGLSLPLDPAVKDADIRMLATEQAQIMRNRDDWQYTHGRPVVDGLILQCLPPDEAFNMFIDRFEELTGQPSGIARHRLASIEAACREKDAEIARLTAERDRQYDENVSLISENARCITERDQLCAKLDEANEIIAALLDIKHGDEKENARAFLTSAPQPSRSTRTEPTPLTARPGSSLGSRCLPQRRAKKPSACVRKGLTMHDADNEVTQEDLAAVDTIGGHMASYYEFGHSDEYAAAQEAARDFRLAATRDLEAEVERLKAEKHQLTMRGLFLSEKYKREICGLEAQLAEARELLERIKESDEASITEMAAVGIDLPDSSGLFAREIAAFLSRTGGEA